MGRIIAIDYGTKRTGIAVSDPLCIIANPLDTVPTGEIIPYLKKYMSINPVSVIVLGKPMQMNGQPSATYEGVLALAKKLGKQFPGIEITLHDERFTSVMAQRAMIEGGVKKSGRRDKALVDRISAAIILQSYMDSTVKNF